MESPIFGDKKYLTSNTVALPKEEGVFSLLPAGEATVFKVKQLLFSNAADSIFSLISGLR